jgi:PPE-repeat protein
VCDESRKHGSGGACWKSAARNDSNSLAGYPTSGTMEEQAIALVSRKQEAAALLSGNVDGGGLAALSGDSGSSLVAALAKVVAEDEAVVDLGQLFRKQAEGSADFESGWAQAWATGEKIAVEEKAAPVGAPVLPVPKPVPPVSRRPTLDELARRHGLKPTAGPLSAPLMPQQMPLFGSATAGGD